MLEAPGNSGDFIGCIAVIVALIYLTNQVRLHTAALRNANPQDICASFLTQNDYLIDSQVSEAYVVGLRKHAINEYAQFFQTAFALYEAGILERRT